MITITDKAKEKLVDLRDKEQRDETFFVRVGVAGGGCSGLMYDLLFDDGIKEQDQIFEDNGIKILVDKKSLLY